MSDRFLRTKSLSEPLDQIGNVEKISKLTSQHLLLKSFRPRGLSDELVAINALSSFNNAAEPKMLEFGHGSVVTPEEAQDMDPSRWASVHMPHIKVGVGWGNLGEKLDGVKRQNMCLHPSY